MSTAPTDAGLRAAVEQTAVRLAPDLWKYANELRYWLKVKRREGTLHNGHYEAFFTELFGLGRDDYAGATVLDVGCGPRGSLEWATMAEARYGLDPLAAVYARLSPDHAMTYVAGPAEVIPFPDDHMDVVSTFNSLDHVGDVGAVLDEVARVLKPGGHLLLITDYGHEPTPCEPQAFGLEIVDALAHRFEVQRCDAYAKQPTGMYRSISEGRATTPSSLPTGILCCHLRGRR